MQKPATASVGTDFNLRDITEYAAHTKAATNAAVRPAI